MVKDRSPIMIHANNTLTGMITIRASRNTEILETDFDAKVNNHTKTYSALVSVQRWFQIRLDVIASTYGMIAVLSSVFGKSLIKADNSFRVFFMKFNNFFQKAILV